MTRRHVLPAPMPSSLLDAFRSGAARRGMSEADAWAVALIDELPCLVAEVVRGALVDELSPDAKAPPALTEGTLLDPSSPQLESGAIVPDSERKLGSGRATA